MYRTEPFGIVTMSPLNFPGMNTVPPRLAGLALAALLGGCAVGPDFAPPPDGLAHVVLAPRQPPADAAALHAGEVPQQWWRLFGDPVLDQLQARVAAGNLDLQAAASRVAQSRARACVAAAAAWPRLAMSGSVSREAVSEHGKFVAMGASSAPVGYWRAAGDGGRLAARSRPRACHVRGQGRQRAPVRRLPGGVRCALGTGPAGPCATPPRGRRRGGARQRVRARSAARGAGGGNGGRLFP